VLRSLGHPIADVWAKTRAFDLRHIPSSIYATSEGEPSPTQAVWMKCLGPLPDDVNLHRAAFAYASDFSILEPVMRAHAMNWSTPGLKVASLDHAMWWHRQARADEWFLYSQESPSAIGGRGLSLGRIFTQDGHGWSPQSPKREWFAFLVPRELAVGGAMWRSRIRS